MSDVEIPDFEDQDAKDEDYHDEEDLKVENVENDEAGDDEDVSGDNSGLEDDDDKNEEEDEDDEEEAAIPEIKPVKRKRGRPPGSGKKKQPKSGRFQPLQVPLDENGQPYAVEGDELMLPEDPDGEEKVDKLGFLKGGREFRLRTFHILGKGQRQYMLATEPARCIGFRDSYLLFQRHRKLLKVKLSEDEKYDLIDREIIPHSYKGRTLGVVTARSIFREFGARVVVGGHRVRDDYYESQAKAENHSSAELADPDDYVPPEGISYDKNQYCAWYNAPAPVDSTAIYESNLKSVLKQQTGTPASPTNPSLETSQPDPSLVKSALRSATLFNKHINRGRIRSMDRSKYGIGDDGLPVGGLLDPQTGVRFVADLTQPSRSVVARISPQAPKGAVMFTTILNLQHEPSRLRLVSPSIYADVDDASRQAILAQIEREESSV